MWPLLLFGTGVALRVSVASRKAEPAQQHDAIRSPSAGQQGSGDEVSAERGEDREVQQAGGGHDR